MAGWPGPIVTDSGGFQAYSLIRQNPRAGSLSDQGIRFQPEGADRPFQLTPEKSIQLQMAYGADILVCLDDCTHVDDAFAEQQASVTRTIKWARRCKEEFERLLRQRTNGAPKRSRATAPAAVRGGAGRRLGAAAAECAEALLEIGFDGYGYGGWPLDAHGKLLHEMLAYTRSLIPRELPMHALGVGQPESVAACVGLGYADVRQRAADPRRARRPPVRLYDRSERRGLPPAAATGTNTSTSTIRSISRPTARSRPSAIATPARNTRSATCIIYTRSAIRCTFGWRQSITCAL